MPTPDLHGLSLTHTPPHHLAGAETKPRATGAGVGVIHAKRVCAQGWSAQNTEWGWRLEVHGGYHHQEEHFYGSWFRVALLSYEG